MNSFKTLGLWLAGAALVVLLLHAWPEMAAAVLVLLVLALATDIQRKGLI